GAAGVQDRVGAVDLAAGDEPDPDSGRDCGFDHRQGQGAVWWRTRCRWHSRRRQSAGSLHHDADRCRYSRASINARPCEDAWSRTCRPGGSRSGRRCPSTGATAGLTYAAGRGWTRPVSYANTASWTRSRRSSLVSALCTWVLTVVSVTVRAAEISW